MIDIRGLFALLPLAVTIQKFYNYQRPHLQPANPMPPDYLGLWRGENNTMVALEKGLRADSRGERANQWLFWKRF